MQNENDSRKPAPSENSALELQVFNTIATELQRLDADSRQRVFQTIRTFFALQPERTQFEPPNAAKRNDPTLTPAVGNTTPSAFSENRSLSPKAFLLEKRPQTDVEKITTLAYYLTHYMSTPYFKTLDLSKLNTDAAQIKFSNPAQAVDNAAKAGLIVQASKGQKQISALGELYVQALPDREAARNAISHARPKRGRNNKRPKSSSVD